MNSAIVEHVPALDVPDFVSDHVEEFLRGERVDRACIQENKRALDAGRECVDLTWTEVKIRHDRRVENVARLAEQAMELGKTVRRGAEITAGELHAKQPLEAPRIQFTNQDLEARRVLKGVERRGIARMFVVLRAKAGQFLGSHEDLHDW